MKLDFHDDKAKKKVMKVASGHSGIYFKVNYILCTEIIKSDLLVYHITYFFRCCFDCRRLEGYEADSNRRSRSGGWDWICWRCCIVSPSPHCRRRCVTFAWLIVPPRAKASLSLSRSKLVTTPLFSFNHSRYL